MSYVAMNKQVISQILSQVNATAQRAHIREIAPLKEKLNNPTIDLKDWIEAKLWGEHIALKDSLPSHWKVHKENLKLILTYAVEGKTYHAELWATASPHFDLPPETSQRLELDSWDDFPDEAYKAAVVDVAHKEWDLNDRTNAIRQQLLPFLQSCKSLNAALRAFPNLRLYVPMDLIARVEREDKKSVDKSVQAAAEKLDVGLISTLAVTDKLSD